MKSLIELYHVSSYKPDGGYSQELLDFFLNGGNRDEVLNLWKELGRSPDSLRQAIKKLKDNLIKEAFLEKEWLSEAQRKRIECWEKFYKVKALLIADKKAAAIYMATEVLDISKKCGFTQIILSISLVLENHYATLEPDTRRYLRYRKIRKTANENYSAEVDSEALYAKLIFYYFKKKDLSELEKEVNALCKNKCKSLRFMQNRNAVLSTWHQLKGEYEKYEATLKETIEFFESKDTFLAYSALTALYQKIALLLIARKKYLDAEKYISRGISLPKEGSYSHHQILQLKAILGLYSNKPNMAFDAAKRAKRLTGKTTKRTSEIWSIINAYLSVLEKLNEKTAHDKFKVSKFLNSVPICEQEKQGLNMSIIIVTFLHHLLDDDKSSFMKRAEGLSAYAHKHLKGTNHIRKRSILHMLKKVEEADYYKLRTETRVGRWKKQLKDNPLQMVDFSEIMPYEKVWEIVLSQLK